ncbi:MAG: hypothetical protein CGW95_09310 [Phenylobacterium zucineum]|nr:MAG: hypothetical protein CGW95_09310 [Phenylobacterium zucineum]
MSVSAQIHYELSARKTRTDDWSLELATEDRGLAVSTAESMIAQGQAIGVKVTKETLDPESREFLTVTILTLGDQTQSKKSKIRENREPLCVAPQDIYSAHARDRIGRLLEGWLETNGVTPFELLHRADLAELLESSGTDLQHAIQKVAIPEAKARGTSVHHLVRSFQNLTDRSIRRLTKDKSQNAFPDLEKVPFADAAERVCHESERTYLLGCAVAGFMARLGTRTEKIQRLLDLASSAPPAGPPRALALSVIEQALSEQMGRRGGLDDLLGAGHDLGGKLALMTRLAFYRNVEALIKAEPLVAKAMPPISHACTRLAQLLASEDFQDVRIALAKNVLAELVGPRRLRPNDPKGEIEIIRALAMALIAGAADSILPDDIQEAFTIRSRMLVTADFIEGYLKSSRYAFDDAMNLIYLVENVIGAANKRQAARYLSAGISGLRFENEFRFSAESSPARLRALAKLHRSLAVCGLAPEDFRPIQTKLAEIAAQVESDCKLIQQLARAQKAPVQRLILLLEMATGEAAPLGPVSEKAATEAIKLARQNELRAELAKNPEQTAQVMILLQQVTRTAAA